MKSVCVAHLKSVCVARDAGLALTHGAVHIFIAAVRSPKPWQFTVAVPSCRQKHIEEKPHR